MKKMFHDGEEVFYYITVMNEKYKMPSIPSRKGIEDEILNGMYKYKGSQKNKHNLHLMGSGSILNETLRAAEILKKNYGIFPDVWSVTGYKQLYDNAIETERANRIRGTNRKSYIEKCIGNKEGIFVAASDYLKALPLCVSKWFPGTYTALGTDGFGLSDHREELREYFEIDAKHIVWAALSRLHEQKKIDKQTLNNAKKKLKIKDDKESPTDIS
jgi:pyruvate dehydrogenase E1 component